MIISHPGLPFVIAEATSSDARACRPHSPISRPDAHLARAITTAARHYPATREHVVRGLTSIFGSLRFASAQWLPKNSAGGALPALFVLSYARRLPITSSRFPRPSYAGPVAWFAKTFGFGASTLTPRMRTRSSL